MNQQAAPFTSSSFPADPKLECDIVMKGGITSGVIYPLAVCELAQVYRLRSVGGASAGAIAAAAAAAAEVGRAAAAERATPSATAEARPATAAAGGGSATTSAPGAAANAAVQTSSGTAGFLGLARFPDDLTKRQPGGKSLLFHLFRPQPEARRAFAVLTAGLDGASSLPKPATRSAVLGLAAKLLAGAAVRFPLRALVGVLPGVLLLAAGVLFLVQASGPVTAVAACLTLIIGLIVVLLGLVVAILTGVLTDLGRLSEVGFGISSGMGQSESDLALTPWLHGKVQELAGRSSAGPPLTFGDLAKHQIDFKVMTTNLSRKQPMSMPWGHGIYFFDPDEFRKLFPGEVVNAMVEHPPPLPTGPAAARDEEVLRLHAGRLRPFPRPDDLPIMVATRMSLSFPLLISAVPLYSVDYTLGPNRDYKARVRQWRHENPRGTPEEHAKAVAPPSFDRNWFSDGGLTANLPVHFFDNPLPNRPTFAIDLAPFGDERPRDADERKNSYLPVVNQGGLHRRTAHWEDKKPLGRMVSFGMSLVTTARTWVDEAQLAMPGYRDRIVTVYQDADEGGFNLSMADEVVKRLSDRGRFAADRLVRRFAGDAPGDVPAEGWDNQRWIRFRSAAAGLNDWFEAFLRGYATTPPGATSYESLLSATERQPSYKLEGKRRAAAQQRTEGLNKLIAAWSSPPVDAFTDDAPRPPPLLRLVAGDPRSDDDT